MKDLLFRRKCTRVKRNNGAAKVRVGCNWYLTTTETKAPKTKTNPWNRDNKHTNIGTENDAMLQNYIRLYVCIYITTFQFTSYMHCIWKTVIFCILNPLKCSGNYSATSNNMKLVHWPLMGGPSHLVQRGGDWTGPQPTQAPPRCTKCNSPPINSQCTNHCIAV